MLSNTKKRIRNIFILIIVATFFFFCFVGPGRYYGNNTVFEINSLDDFMYALDRGFEGKINMPRKFLGVMDQAPTIKEYKLNVDIDFGGIEYKNKISQKYEQCVANGEDASLKGVGVGMKDIPAVINGNGHTIKNLKIVGDAYASLLGKLNVDNGNSSLTIKDLTMENISVTGGQYSALIAGYVTGTYAVSVENVKVKNCIVNGSSSHIGGLFGHLNDAVGTIKNCELDNLSVLGGEDVEFVGGIAGKITGSHNQYVVVTDCSVNGKLTGKNNVAGIIGEFEHANEKRNQDRLIEFKNLTSDVEVDADFRAAGIIANLSFYDYENFTFTNCVSGASNTTKRISSEGNVAGGILGSANWNGDVLRVSSGSQINFNNCTNNSMLVAGEFTAGIAAYLCDKFWGAKFSNCTNNGHILTNNYAGGICSAIEGEIVGGRQFEFVDCVNTGCVEGDQYVGGILGYNDDMNPLFKRCKSSGEFEYYIVGTAYVGGISGIYGTFENCDNSMDIVVASTLGISKEYIGGIVGYTKDSTFAYCTNSGNIEKSSELTSCPEINYVGGIAGYATRLYLSDCSNSGDIYGTNHVGGFIGKVDVPLIAGYSNDIINCTNTGNVYAIGELSTTAEDYQNDRVCGGIGLVIGTFNTGYKNFEFKNISITGNIYILNDTNYVGGWCGRMIIDHLDSFKAKAQGFTCTYNIYLSQEVSQVCEENCKYGSAIFDEDAGTFNKPALVVRITE